MPLSEQEQRLLEEMERSLYHNDADYVAGAARHGKPTYGRIVIGVLIGVVGVAVLISGVALRFPILGVVGFAAMFFGVLVALTPPRANLSSRPVDETDAPGKTTGGSFLQNLGDRWDNRPDEREE